MAEETEDRGFRMHDRAHGGCDNAADAPYVLIDRKRPVHYIDEATGLHVTRGNAWSGPGCHLGCAVEIYTDDEGRVIRVEGDEESPFNNGRLCSRCLALTEVVYHEDRIKYPMKRDPKDRGKDKWERISWDEAFDLAYEKLNGIREKYGAETVLFLNGTSRDVGAYLTRLAWSFGSPHKVFPMSGMSCFAPRVSGCFANTGSFWVGDYSQQLARRYDDPEWKVPEHILIWGNNPLISNSDGLYGHWVTDCMKLGSKTIVIDPKCTWLASRAEHFLQIRPGTDAALALCFINIIAKEDLYDHKFVELWCYGFDEIVAAAEEFTPERTSEITGIPAEDILDTIRDFANSDSGILQWGVAIDMTKEAVPTSQAMIAIMAILGFIEKPGCMVVPSSIVFYAGGWGNELLPREQDEKRAGYFEYPLVGQGFFMDQTDALIKQMETDEPYKIRAAWFSLTNFLSCAAVDPKRTLEAYKRLEFIVGMEIFMTPTVMALADLVFPGVTYPERDGVRLGDGCQRGETINQAIEPLFDTKSDMEIFLTMGRRFNPEGWPWETVEEMFDFMYEQTGFAFKEMQEISPAFVPFEYYKHEKGKLRSDGKPGFNTSTGRIELWSTFYNAIGLNPTPYFEEPVPGPVSTPDLYEEYPLILTTGARQWASFHSEHRQIPHLRAMHPDAVLEINPETAKRFGVDEGDWVWLENQYGRCKRKVVITEALLDGVGSTDHAWWLPEAPGEAEDGLFGLWDMAVGQLIPYIPGKYGFGSNYKSLLAKIYKVEEA